MKSINDLFCKHGVASFHDAVLEATSKSCTDAELLVIFSQLPIPVQAIAHQWGLSDTVFRDEAYRYLRGD